MSKYRVLSLKPQLRLERRGHDGQSETEQPDHSTSLGDSITSANRMRFSVHTGQQQTPAPQPQPPPAQTAILPLENTLPRIPSAGGAAKQLLRRQSMASSHRADRVTARQNLRDNPRLILRAPLPATAGAGKDFQSPHRFRDSTTHCVHSKPSGEIKPKTRRFSMSSERWPQNIAYNESKVRKKTRSLPNPLHVSTIERVLRSKRIHFERQRSSAQM
jgi:hypothetical protein